MSGFFAGLTGKALSIALVLLAAGGLMIGAATLVYKATTNVQSIIDKAVARAEDATRAQCKAQIAQSNSETNAKIAAQSRAIIQVQADATDKIAEINRDQAAKRKDNEVLPNGGSCGIDAAHGRLLIR
jgi:hypothetical protein